MSTSIPAWSPLENSQRGKERRMCLRNVSGEIDKIYEWKSIAGAFDIDKATKKKEIFNLKSWSGFKLASKML